MSDEKKRLLDCLLKVKASKKLRKYGGGICSCVDDAWGKGTPPKLQMRLLFRKWPHYSGTIQYPVPSCKKGDNNYSAFFSCVNLWDRRTAYGRLRWDLLEFMIKTLQEELNAPRKDDVVSSPS